MKKFDVLIVGTGMGGLVCGNILAKQGYTVCMVEICDSFPLYGLLLQANDEKQEAMVISAKKFIESITENRKLQAVLAGNNMLYAGSGEATPFYIHALTVNSYIESAWRCLDGG